MTKRARRRQTKRELRWTAYHEAGHAIVALDRSVRFRYVTIRPGESGHTLGHLRHVSRKAGALYRRFPGAIDIDQILISCAGVVAESFVRRRYHHVGASRDYDTAYRWACQRDETGREGFLDTDPLPQAIVVGAGQQAKKILERWRPALDELANALLAKTTVRYGEAKAIFERITNMNPTVSLWALDRHEPFRESDVIREFGLTRRHAQWTLKQMVDGGVLLRLRGGSFRTRLSPPSPGSKA